MSRRTIPGRVHHLHQALVALDRESTERRVRALSAQGIGEHEIARLTGLNLAVVQKILAGATLNLERGGA